MWSSGPWRNHCFQSFPGFHPCWTHDRKKHPKQDSKGSCLRLRVFETRFFCCCPEISSSTRSMHLEPKKNPKKWAESRLKRCMRCFIKHCAAQYENVWFIIERKYCFKMFQVLLLDHLFIFHTFSCCRCFFAGKSTFETTWSTPKARKPFRANAVHTFYFANPDKQA